MEVGAGGRRDWGLFLDLGEDVKKAIEMWGSRGVGYIANVTLVLA